MKTEIHVMRVIENMNFGFFRCRAGLGRLSLAEVADPAQQVSKEDRLEFVAAQHIA